MLVPFINGYILHYPVSTLQGLFLILSLISINFSFIKTNYSSVS